MRSLDPMRNFPELDGLPDAEAQALVRNTQKRISREPAILIGLLASVGLTAIVIMNAIRLEGLIGALIAGVLIGAVAVVYMVLVVKPRMKAAFREMGYPKGQGGVAPE